MKKKIVVVVLILLIVLGSYLIYNISHNKAENKNETKANEVLSVVNLFEKMEIDEYFVDDFTFTAFNLSLNEGNDSIELVFTSDISVSNIIFEVSLFDKDNNLLDEIDFSVDDLFVGEERNLFCYVDIDLSNIESFSIRVKND